MLKRRTAILVALLLPGMSDCRASVRVGKEAVGHWEGTTTTLDGPMRVAFDISEDRCTVDAPELGVHASPLASYDFQGGAFSVEVPGRKPLHLVGRILGDEMSGRSRGTPELSFELRRTSLSPRLLPEFPVRYSSVDVRLAGTLILPEGNGPFPGIVLIHGSAPVGKMTRARLHDRASLFARSGIAALIYDRRGNGESEGAPDRILPMDVLARDAAAGAAFLATREEIAPDRIGFYGISQGAWVAPYAASLFPATRFVIAVSAPGISPDEQNAFGSDKLVERTLRAALAAVHSPDVDRVITDQQQFAPQVDDAGPEVVPGFSHFDPLPYWERLRVPVLLVYGDQDRVVPVERSRERIEQALARGGNDRSTVRVMAGADHELRLTASDDANPFRRIAPEAEEMMAGWLRSVAVGL
jgi:pimeloyl-ACP methyl ester carboxylesterase